MKKLAIFLVILVLIPVFVAVLFKRVPPATIGVKQSQWGGGIIQADNKTGFHLGISGYHKWHFLPAATHFIHFTETPASSPSPTETYLPPFEFRTSDQNTITYDITVAYRIANDGAWQIVKDGLKMEYRSRVKSKVESILREQLVKFSSEDLQLTDNRMKLVAAALPILEKDLSEFHCEAEQILIRRFRFREGYEGQLQEKQFLRQKALLDVAETAVAEQEQLVNVKERKIVAAELALVQDWEKRVQEKQSEYDVLLATIRAEAEVYAAETMAEGDAELVIAQANGTLAVEKAEALRDELRNKALNTKGGHILLALEAAKNLHVPRVTLNSDDPSVPTILDLGELTKMLVGSSE
ncbi:MAG: SPFH domain-containing protein [Planctomycetota bacterium]|jgi:regulator of protease activity HflC (stomatin/prohibitin superfamily)